MHVTVCCQPCMLAFVEPPCPVRCACFLLRYILSNEYVSYNGCDIHVGTVEANSLLPATRILRDATPACCSPVDAQISTRRHRSFSASSLYGGHASLARHPRRVALRHTSMQPGANSPAARCKRGRHNAKPSGVPPDFDSEPMLTDGMRTGQPDDAAGPSWRVRSIESRRRHASDFAVIAEPLPPPPPPSRPRNRVLEIGMTHVPTRSSHSTTQGLRGACWCWPWPTCTTPPPGLPCQRFFQPSRATCHSPTARGRR